MAQCCVGRVGGRGEAELSRKPPPVRAPPACACPHCPSDAIHNGPPSPRARVPPPPPNTHGEQHTQCTVKASALYTPGGTRPHNTGDRGQPACPQGTWGYGLSAPPPPVQALPST